MFRAVIFLLIVLNAAKLTQSSFGVCCTSELSDKNQAKMLVDDLINNIIKVDVKISAFCRINEDVVIKESYATDSYKLSLTLPLENSNQVKVLTRHRVLYIQAQNPSENFDYEYVTILTNILYTKALTWSYRDGVLTISVPYKGKLGVINDVSCSEGISGKINYVYEVNGSSITKSEGNSAAGSGSGASAGSGVIVGAKNGAIAEGQAGAYSKSAAGAGVGNSAAVTDATAVADARSIATAATNANAASVNTGDDSNSKAVSVSKGVSYTSKTGSVAHSASLAGAESKGNGTRSASGSSGLSSGYNVGGEKGIGASSSLVSSSAISEGPDGIALSSSTSATRTVNLFGNTQSATVTTSSAIGKNGTLYSVTVTPTNNVTTTIIDVKI